MLLIATKLLDAFGLKVVAGRPAALDNLLISLYETQVITVKVMRQETQLKLVVADRTKPEVEIWRRPKKSTF